MLAAAGAGVGEAPAVVSVGIGLHPFDGIDQVDHPGVRAAVAIAHNVHRRYAAALAGVAGEIPLIAADTAFLANLLKGVELVQILAGGGAFHNVFDGAVGL